jgi:hypothetical protein
VICRAPYPAPANSHTPHYRRFPRAKPRHAGDAVPLLQPCPDCASLRCVVPSSTSPSLCAYRRATSSPFSHAPEYHHYPPLAPPLDLAVEPHFPLLLRPNRGSKRVALDLLVLPDFPMPPSLTGPSPPIARISPELLLTWRQPNSGHPSPTEHSNSFP